MLNSFIHTETLFADEETEAERASIKQLTESHMVDK